MKVATSIVTGKEASPALASKAVINAMHKAEITMANSVLIFLSSEFAANPQPAIKAAAQAANCTQVMGCSAIGVFTEDDWVLDAPAVAVMVFGGNVALKPAMLNTQQQALLTLSAPNAINSTWLNDKHSRYGGVSGDAIGQGQFSVWKNAKGETTGFVDAFIDGVQIATQASHGLLLITQAQLIQQTEGFNLIAFAHQQKPIFSLQKAWKAHTKSIQAVPLHLIIVVYGDSVEAIQQGQYQQTMVVSIDEVSGSITLAKPLKAGQFICWALRDSTVAQADMLLMTQTLSQRLNHAPHFGLLFSCLARGPYLYDGLDRDWMLVKQQFCQMPLLGFYGNGEVAEIAGKNQLLPYSAVLSLAY
ncbi:MAG: histidine kinase [Methylotenera sp.]|nr:histidine kinase [Methylotenera sp.]